MKIIKKIAILSLASLYTINKPAEIAPPLSQSSRGDGTLVNEDEVIADDLSNIVALLEKDIALRKAQVRKKGAFKDLRFKAIDTLSGDIIKHFSANDLQNLLGKYNQQQAVNSLLAQFREKSTEINESLKATKGFFGGRSATNEWLIKYATIELLRLYDQINNIATGLYTKEKEIKHHREYVKSLIVYLEEELPELNAFDGQTPRLINIYLNSDVIEEEDKKILHNFLDYIRSNFTYFYDYEEEPLDIARIYVRNPIQ